MISAKEAKERAMEVVLNAELSKLEPLIKEAADKGKTHICINKTLYPEGSTDLISEQTRDFLTNAGYKVVYDSEDYMYTIWWD